MHYIKTKWIVIISFWIINYFSTTHYEDSTVSKNNVNKSFSLIINILSPRANITVNVLHSFTYSIFLLIDVEILSVFIGIIFRLFYLFVNGILLLKVNMFFFLRAIFIFEVRLHFWIKQWMIWNVLIIWWWYNDK